MTGKALRITLWCALLATFGPCWQSSVHAQGFPAKAIRIIVPYTPGGTSDILARLIGTRLAESWGYPAIVDNRTGASGIIGAEMTARAAPDGYTLLLTDIGNFAISAVVFSKLPFDIMRDFTPVMTLSYSPHLLVTHPSVPARTTRELIAIARAHPGKLNFPIPLGGASHLAGLMFEQQTGIKWVYIPTKGGSQAVYAIATGDGDVMFLGMLQTLPHVKLGRLRLIAVSSEQRLASLPEVPIVGETLPGFVTGSWQGILAPARTPSEVIARISAEVGRILKSSEVRDVLMSQGTTPQVTGSAETSRWLAAEKERWATVVRVSGFKIE